MSPTTTDSQSKNFHWPRVALLLALLGGLAYAAFLGFGYGHHTAHRSQLSTPAAAVIQDPDTLAPALAARGLATISPNHTTVKANVWGGDRTTWLRHVYNVSAQQGWYPHSLGDGSLRIVLPNEDLDILSQAAADPYGWLAAHQNDDAPAEPPVLGDNPAYVHLWTSTEEDGKAALALRGAILAAILAFLVFMATVITVAEYHGFKLAT